MSTSYKPFPFEIVDLVPAIAPIKDFFKGQTSEYVQVGPKKWLLPKQYKICAEKFYNMQLKPDDVIISGFPRSGTTVTEELAWLLENNLNYDKVDKTNHTERIPFFRKRNVDTTFN